MTNKKFVIFNPMLFLLLLSVLKCSNKKIDNIGEMTTKIRVFFNTSNNEDFRAYLTFKDMHQINLAREYSQNAFKNKKIIPRANLYTVVLKKQMLPRDHLFTLTLILDGEICKFGIDLDAFYSFVFHITDSKGIKRRGRVEIS